MQLTLVIVGFLLGFFAWWISGRLLFLFGALFMLANWPWTLFGTMTINRTLMAMDPVSASGQSRALPARWNRLHAVRTALGGLATGIVPLPACLTFSMGTCRPRSRTSSTSLNAWRPARKRVLAYRLRPLRS